MYNYYNAEYIFVVSCIFVFIYCVYILFSIGEPTNSEGVALDRGKVSYIHAYSIRTVILTLIYFTQCIYEISTQK